MSSAMVVLMFFAGLFLFALYVKITDVSKYPHLGVGGKYYNKPLPDKMRRDQLELYRSVKKAKEEIGMDPLDAGHYAMGVAANIDPRPYGLKLKPEQPRRWHKRSRHK